MNLSNGFSASLVSSWLVPALSLNLTSNAPLAFLTSATWLAVTLLEASPLLSGVSTALLSKSYSHGYPISSRTPSPSATSLTSATGVHPPLVADPIQNLNVSVPRKYPCTVNSNSSLYTLEEN